MIWVRFLQLLDNEMNEAFKMLSPLQRLSVFYFFFSFDNKQDLGFWN